MKRRSILGFVMGLIGAISAAIFAFYLYIVFSVVLSLSEGLGGDTSGNIVLKVLILANILSVIVAIVASAFYFTKARVGGFIMLGSLVMNISFPALITFTSESIEVSLVILLIPSIFMLISAIAGICAKARPKLTSNNVIQNGNDTKFCSECGAQMNSGDEFCPNCGSQQ